MTRSAISTGKIDARDRAKVRGRRDRRPSRPDDAWVLLDEWMASSGYGAIDPAAMTALDLDAYLSSTAHIHIDAQERLRQLAIFCEDTFVSVAPSALDRIYQTGLRIDDEDAYLWHSRGIAGKRAALRSPSPSPRWQKLALRCFHRARELDPEDAGIAYSLAHWHYDFGDASEAAEWFDETLRLEPAHGYAMLYRAHGLCDELRWTEAAEAYAAVPLDTFVGRKAYLVDVVAESRGHCLLHAGDHAGAAVEFERLLDRIEKDTGRSNAIDVRSLGEACRGPLRERLGARFERVASLLTDDA